MKKSEEVFLAELGSLGRNNSPWLAAGALIFLGALVFSAMRVGTAEKELAKLDAQIEGNRAIITAQQESIRHNDERIRNLAQAALPQFGWARDSLSRAMRHEPAQVAASLDANDELRKIARPAAAVEGRSRVTYFAKDARVDTNQQHFISGLREMGFEVSVARPVNRSEATNAVWFGSGVPEQEVKLIAYSMIRAGYRLKYIAPLRNPTGARADLIQIGAQPQLTEMEPLSVADVRAVRIGTEPVVSGRRKALPPVARTAAPPRAAAHR